MRMRAAQVCASAALIFASVAPARGQVTPAGQAAAQPQPDQTVSAYPTWELGGGYQWLRSEGDQTFPFGLNVDGAWNLREMFGAVAEIGWAMDSEDLEDAIEVTSHVWNFGVGPRWNVRTEGTVWPFVQVLAGALYSRASTEAAGLDVSLDDTSFMLQPGAGVNVVVGDGWGIVGQVDYRRVFTDEDETGESGIDQFRVFVGARMLLD